MDNKRLNTQTSSGTKHGLQNSSSYLFKIYTILVTCFLVITLLLATRFQLLSGPSFYSDNEVRITQPIVFIGGHPRSGTTLMRVMLDVHPLIRCGPETHILPKMVAMFNQTLSGRLNERLKAANLSIALLEKAFRRFIDTIIISAGDPSQMLCNKDPLLLSYMPILEHLYPQVKFIHLVRDGRAVTASVIKRKVRIGNRPLKEEPVFRAWEFTETNMLDMCEASRRCLTVRYEDLVLRPEKTTKAIFQFLGIPWDPVVLQHEEHIKENTVLSSMEKSTSQVVYPINLEALTSWYSNKSILTRSFIEDKHKTSPLLKRLGYFDLGFPPFYGEPEPAILKRTKQLKLDKTFVETFQ